jgi:hypothetical protein
MDSYNRSRSGSRLPVAHYQILECVEVLVESGVLDWGRQREGLHGTRRTPHREPEGRALTVYEEVHTLREPPRLLTHQFPFPNFYVVRDPNPLLIALHRLQQLGTTCSPSGYQRTKLPQTVGR